MSTDTRDALLDAAAELLTSAPYDEVSVRAVRAAAGANPAAVHYHFGSKEKLVAALLEDRFAATWTASLDGLAATPTGVAEIVDAILDPIVALQADASSAPGLRLLAQFAAAHPATAWTRPWFRFDNWVDLLTATVPGLDPATARRRWRFAFTVLIAELAAPRPVSAAAIAALREFLTAGLAGPAAPNGSPTP
ncbi:TetR family transcriptional regulator [Gordonia shandongensis]|uniref:TetR family transcriptional regulator n=1 Tax=Gordonia shandongensis TaxID=376351 RepID=UPI00041F7755|nr:TetR family transcriptional regulator [Gordonia shandongensis]